MYYIMSDIHGSQREFRKALRSWDESKEKLVIMGDFIDRGPNSLGMIKDLMTLTRELEDKVFVLMGNHEEMFLSWLKESPENQNLYYSTTHLQTLISMLGSSSVIGVTPSEIAENINKKYKKEIDWMSNLDLYLEEKKFILVHAGIDFEDKNWRKNKDYLLWARKEFIYSKVKPEKRVFFGHTPTILLHNSNDIWMNMDKTKVGIDGGVSIGGQLNALKVNDKGEIVSISHFK